MLSKYQFKGIVLDIGGGDLCKYRKLIKCDIYHSINIDESIKPTWLIKQDEKFPIEDESYDTIISLNTIEHIYDTYHILYEILRILRPNGKFIVSVPFLYPMHAHPDDFFRPTSSWWIKTLTNMGFNTVVVTPLVWGPFSTGIECSGIPGPFKKLRRHMSLIMDIIHSYIIKKKCSEEFYYNQIKNQSLAFYILATK